MPFRNEEISLLREAGLDSLLPTFDVYLVGKKLHFNKQCAPPKTLAVQKSFLEVADSKPIRCKDCQKHTSMRLYRRISSEYATIPWALNHLKSAENTAAACAVDMGPDIDSLYIDLTYLHHGARNWLEAFSLSKDLSSYAETFSDRIKAANDTIVAHIRTDAVKQSITEIGEFKSYLGSENNNYVMFLIDYLVDFNLLTAKAYGEEITPDVWIIHRSVAEKIAVAATRTLVNIPTGTSSEVLQTMARLWEPGSHTALGDGNKVYAAAIILTPER